MREVRGGGSRKSSQRSWCQFGGWVKVGEEKSILGKGKGPCPGEAGAQGLWGFRSMALYERQRSLLEAATATWEGALSVQLLWMFTLISLAWHIISLPGMLGSIIRSIKYPTCLWARHTSVFRYTQDLHSLGAYGVVRDADWEPQKPVLFKEEFGTRVAGLHHRSLADSFKRPSFVLLEFGSAGTQHRFPPEHAGVYRWICVCPDSWEEAQSFFSLVVLAAFNAMLSPILFLLSPCSQCLLWPLTPWFPPHFSTAAQIISLTATRERSSWRRRRERRGRGEEESMPLVPLLCASAGTLLGTLHVLTHLMLTITTGERYYYHPHFVNEEIEAQGCWATCLNSHSW